MKKALFLIIDALRYDVLNNPVARRALVPNLAKLADCGFVIPATANGQATQFVMPSLFSLTYPLDYGGYNNGIRERPKSYIESLREAGFETHLMAPGNQLGITQGYERGFTTVQTTSDYRTLLQQRIERMLSYELQLWQKRERSDASMLTFLQQEFALLLQSLVEAIERHNKSLWPRKLLRINRRVADGCVAELDLLRHEPQLVLAKLVRIAPGVYWRFLGRRHVGKVEFFISRIVASASWRARKYISAHTWFPFLPLSHRQSLTGDVTPTICRFIEGASDRQWYIHMHVMDAHDCRAINRPFHVVGRLRYFPRWLVARLRGLTKRRFLYDSAVMYVDHHAGKLVRAIERSGQRDDTIIFVTGDHGSQYAESPRPKEEVGLRTHYEHIDVPLLVAGVRRRPAKDGLVDSMGVAATLLDVLGVPLHSSHKGVSAFAGGRPAIISESCGHGNADLARRNIYLTVTTAEHRMMALLVDDQVQIKKLYDRRADPRELHNLADKPELQKIKNELVDHLRRERASLIALRRVAA
jgi:Sulfatase